MLYRVTLRSAYSSPISNQLWRTLLGLPLAQKKNASTVPETKSAKRQQAVFDILANCLNTSDGISINTSPSTEITWQGITLQTDVAPSTNIARQILWELTELNFHSELVALDYRAHNAPPLTRAIPLESEKPGIPQAPPDTREDLIARCFSGNHLAISANLDDANKGLAAPLWTDRRQYLVALHSLMSTWTGFHAYAASNFFTILITSPELLTENETNLLEHLVAGFYTQSFFNFFGRAAIILHRL